MVEDEFLAVAGEFTRHLHAAEYQRLRGLAKSQNAETIQNISRPVTGEMTDLVKRRHAALDTAAKQRRGISRALGKRAARDGSGSDGEEAPARQPVTSLQGLMDSPRKQAVLLTSLPGTRSGASLRGQMDASPSRRLKVPSNPETRLQARGSHNNWSDRMDEIPSVTFKREPTPDSDDDDLDGQPVFPLKYRDTQRPERGGRLTARQPATEPPTETKIKARSPSKPFPEPSNGPRRTDSTRGIPPSEDIAAAHNNEEDDDFFTRLRARRAEQRRRRESKLQDSKSKTEESQTVALNEIPFL